MPPTSTRRPPGRPRRQGGEQLGPDLIIDAALRLAARGRDDVFTVRRLGEELRADPSTLYRHFRDKDDLMMSVADRMIGEVVDAVPNGLPWQERLRALAIHAVMTSAKYPAVGMMVAPRTVRRHHEFRAVELILGALHEAGLTGRAAALHYRAFGDLVLALSGTRAATELLHPDLRAKDTSSWGREYRSVDPHDFPHIAALAAELAEVSDDDVLEHAVAAMIAAVAAAAAAAAEDGTRAGHSTTPVAPEEQP